MEGHGLITLAVVVFGVVLLIAWIVLPFAVIGIKPLLQELLTELQKTNKILAATQAAAGHQHHLRKVVESSVHDTSCLRRGICRAPAQDFRRE